MTYPHLNLGYVLSEKTTWENGPVFRGLVYTGKLLSYE